MHEVQVNVVGIERFERRSDALFDTLVPWVVELSGDPDLFTWDTRVLDSLSDLVLVAVSKSSVDVAVSSEKGGLDSVANLVWL